MEIYPYLAIRKGSFYLLCMFLTTAHFLLISFLKSVLSEYGGPASGTILASNKKSGRGSGNKVTFDAPNKMVRVSSHAILERRRAFDRYDSVSWFHVMLGAAAFSSAVASGMRLPLPVLAKTARRRMQMLPSVPSPLSPPRASASSAAAGDTDRKPWLLVGLGNPGKLYQGTRHNVWTSDFLHLLLCASSKLG